MCPCQNSRSWMIQTTKMQFSISMIISQHSTNTSHRIQRVSRSRAMLQGTTWHLKSAQSPGSAGAAPHWRHHHSTGPTITNHIVVVKGMELSVIKLFRVDSINIADDHHSSPKQLSESVTMITSLMVRLPFLT